MNYYRASQRLSDKRWDFTQTRDKETWPVGYCRGPWPIYTEEDYTRVPGLKAEVERDYEPHKDKFHDGGHETAEQACECYRQYLLDTRVRKVTFAETQHKCEKCGEWTNEGVEIDHHHHFLCSPHQGRETLEEVFPKVYSITSSW